MEGLTLENEPSILRHQGKVKMRYVELKRKGIDIFFLYFLSKVDNKVI